MENTPIIVDFPSINLHLCMIYIYIYTWINPPTNGPGPFLRAPDKAGLRQNAGGGAHELTWNNNWVVPARQFEMQRKSQQKYWEQCDFIQDVDLYLIYVGSIGSMLLNIVNGGSKPTYVLACFAEGFT